jgi:hypothetical protein
VKREHATKIMIDKRWAEASTTTAPAVPSGQ